MDYLIRKALKKLEEGLDKKDIAYYYFGKPRQLSDEVLNRGVICLIPVVTTVNAVTTGVTDQENFELNLVVAKQAKTDFYMNAQEETSSQFLTRVIEGKDENNILRTNSVRYIIRNNMRQLGILQPEMVINYDSEEFENMGAISATMVISQIDHQQQLV